MLDRLGHVGRAQPLRSRQVGENAPHPQHAVERADVILEGDLQYAPEAPAIRARVAELARGATLLVADCGRSLFEREGLELLATVERSRLLGDHLPWPSSSAAIMRHHQLASVTPGEVRIFVRRP